MLSTIKVLSQIENDFKKSKSLEGYLPSLISSLQSEKKIVFTNMNGKQKLSQLQSLIESEMKKIDNTLLSLNVNLQDIEDQEISHDESQENEGEQFEQEIEDENEGQQQELDEDEDAQIDGEEDMQMDEENGMEVEEGQDEQFVEPEFNNENMEEQQQAEDYEEEEMPSKKKGTKKDNYDKFHEQGQEQQNEQDQEQLDSQEDVGLYGQQLNENDEDFEGYDNQFDQEQFQEFQKQFGDKQTKTKKDKKKKLKDQEESQNADEHIQDNFDHFREIQLDNQKQQQQQTVPKTDLDNQIDRLQGKVAGKKDWAMKGEIKARQRPANSLLQYDLQFNSGVKYTHQITEQRNTELEELIKKRILNDMFDDRTRFVNTNHIRQHFGSLKEVSREKSKMGLGELYESQFKNFLGIGENKNDKLKTQIMDSFKELNYFLDSLSNFSFVPKPTKDNSKKGQQAIIVEQKVPLTLWNGQKQVQKDGKMRFESEKQVDNQAKRLKNKRIARQRKKEQMKKKLNKVIQYGGITKFEAQAKKKAQMNNKPLKIDGVNMKYNKSSSFFKNITENKGGKPNPDISKMKI